MSFYHNTTPNVVLSNISDICNNLHMLNHSVASHISMYNESNLHGYRLQILASHSRDAFYYPAFVFSANDLVD